MSAKIDRVPTTDEVDSITPEERNALVGYCDRCEEWFRFTRGVHYERCPKCKSNFSNAVGFQLITQRTFTDSKKKKRNTKVSS